MNRRPPGDGDVSKLGESENPHSPWWEYQR